MNLIKIKEELLHVHKLKFRKKISILRFQVNIHSFFAEKPFLG